MRIGIDLGGTKIEAAALGPQGAILARERVATPRDDYAATLRAIVALVRCSGALVGRPGHGDGDRAALEARKRLPKPLRAVERVEAVRRFGETGACVGRDRDPRRDFAGHRTDQERQLHLAQRARPG